MNYLIILLLTLTSIHPMDIKLRYLEHKTGCRFKITSGNRTLGHNIKVGGSKKSRHLMNKSAYDLRSYDCNLSYSEIGLVARNIFGGVIVYDNHIHVDDRKIRYFRELAR